MSTKNRRSPENGGVGGDMLRPSYMTNRANLVPLLSHAFAVGRPDALLLQLNSVVKKQEAEIEELCKGHYEEFILAVDDLRSLLLDALELKAELTRDNNKLQETVTALLFKIDEFIELYSLAKNVSEAIKMSNYCIHVLELCQEGNNQLSKGRFYHVLRTLDAIQRNYLENVPVKALRTVIEKRITVIRSHIERRSCEELNEWLVEIRTSSRDIGQTAIGYAASSRQRNNEMLALQREIEEDSYVGLEDISYNLDAVEHVEEWSFEIDLSTLYRAYQVHCFLGLEEQIRDYYCKNRLLQLESDLEISSGQPFLEYYQTFLAQIVGFFIIEDRVRRTGHGLVSSDHVDTMWETTVEKMTVLLKEQCSHIDSIAHLVAVKDYVTLLAIALEKCMYKVSPLLEVVNNTRDKFHELLIDDCRQRISVAVSSDTYEQMVIRKEADYNTTVKSFHLQAFDVVPSLPYVAPFSSMVPEICHIVRSFVNASVEYMSYGGTMDFYGFVKYLEKPLIDVINEVLLETINRDSVSVSQAMQLAANIPVLERACDFFLRHAARQCGLLRSSMEMLALKTSTDAACHTLLRLINSKLDEFMALVRNINWTCEDLPQNQNDYVNEVVIYLDTIISAGQHVLPSDALYAVGRGTLEHISNTIIEAFLSDGVKRFNINAVHGFDRDLRALESFANERFRSTGLVEIYWNGGFGDCLVEARQLINLLLSDHPESFMNSGVREKNYGALDLKKVSVICDKFKDSPDSIFGSLSNRNTKQNPRKKSMDLLKRRLKDFTWTT